MEEHDDAGGARRLGTVDARDERQRRRPRHEVDAEQRDGGDRREHERRAFRASTQNAPLPSGVPRPVGPSYPAPAVQRYVPPQEPLLPLVTSNNEVACAYG